VEAASDWRGLSPSRIGRRNPCPTIGPKPSLTGRIIIHKDYELRFWSKKFGVSPNELRRAVSNFADDVAREFGIEVRDEPFVGILAMRDAQLICP
jgi:hypothetical protein